jgi:hypothetical protein
MTLSRKCIGQYWCRIDALSDHEREELLHKDGTVFISYPLNLILCNAIMKDDGRNVEYIPVLITELPHISKELKNENS